MDLNFKNMFVMVVMAHSLKNIAILNAKGATFRCLLMGISKNKGLKKLNNSVTYDRGVLWIWILYQEFSIKNNLFFFVTYNNGWEHWFNLLSKKQRCDTK